jgi:dTDP-4-amino-4,6-dideoxygalactose transaminase
MINVNKPYLPVFDNYVEKIKTIWHTNHLTNYGKLEKELESKLSEYLELPEICLLNNCTNGLLTSLSSFNSEDEIITTPFSFVATTSSIIWSKLKPVFCDIDSEYFFINPQLIEEKITNKTKAVLATHIYGNTGDIECLEKICKKNNLILIFDAAHAFGVKYKNKSILEYGDVSVLSFHATKTYHTIEGGAIYAKDKKTLDSLRLKTNFGFKNYQINEIGINSKMSEFNAAMGLCCLEEINKIFQERKDICEAYDFLLKNNKTKKIKINKDIEWNYSYYPILFNSEQDLLNTIDSMNKNQIFPRRYFYPSLNSLHFVEKINMNISDNISKRILCLPLYCGLQLEEIEKIAKIID